MYFCSNYEKLLSIGELDSKSNKIKMLCILSDKFLNCVSVLSWSLKSSFWFILVKYGRILVSVLHLNLSLTTMLLCNIASVAEFELCMVSSSELLFGGSRFDA